MSLKPYKNSLTLVAVLIVVAIVVTSCRNIADKVKYDSSVMAESEITAVCENA